jgi:hypothetical protein
MILTFLKILKLHSKANLKGRDNLGNPRVDEKIILKWSLKQQGVKK